VRSFWSFCIPVLLAVLSSGCAPALPDIDGAGSDIASASGTSRAIEYRTIGEPIDATDASFETLTLPDAVGAALQHDANLQAALARLRAALADAQQARLLPNPILSVVARFPEGGGKTTIEAGLSAELLSLLQRPRRVSAADHRLHGASSEVLTVALDLVADVQETHATIQSIDAELANLQEQQELVNRLASIARARVEAGEAARLDVLTLDAERMRVDAELLDAQAQRRDERLRLARLLGTPSSAAEWTVAPWQPPALPTTDEKLWIQQAIEHRPEVMARRWELAALDEESSLAGWNWFDGAEVGIEAERDEGEWSVGPGVALPLPLLDSGQAQRGKATAAQVEARHNLVHAQRQVVEDVRRALASVQSAQRSLDKVRDELIPLLERRHEQATSAYQIGEADITAILLAEQELQEARSRRIELERRVASAHTKLLRAAGGPGIAASVTAGTQPAGEE
jgi:cobalt-zinc-cadmium efflux system outer membrane protein